MYMSFHSSEIIWKQKIRITNRQFINEYISHDSFFWICNNNQRKKI